MSIDVDAFFSPEQESESESEFYPGSRRKRRPKGQPKERSSAPEELGRPVQKLLNGDLVDFYSAGALATALGKSLVTIRLWERKGYLPKAPYRLISENADGPLQAGRRYYTLPLIAAAVDEFQKRGLLDARVEWGDHPDLPVAIAERWRAITNPDTDD